MVASAPLALLVSTIAVFTDKEKIFAVFGLLISVAACLFWMLPFLLVFLMP